MHHSWFRNVICTVLNTVLFSEQKIRPLRGRLQACLAVVVSLSAPDLYVQVKGPERDIHSGNDGGVFNEPLSDLTKLLASLVDSRNNIMVPGFYSGVRPNTLGAALQRLDSCHEFSLEGYREALGIPKLASAANMRSAITSFCLHCNMRSSQVPFLLFGYQQPVE